jgi:hypothetical protein
MSLMNNLVIMHSMSVSVDLSVEMAGKEFFTIVASPPPSLWYLELL